LDDEPVKGSLSSLIIGIYRRVCAAGDGHVVEFALDGKIKKPDFGDFGKNCRSAIGFSGFS